jgi:predicted GTPase
VNATPAGFLPPGAAAVELRAVASLAAADAELGAIAAALQAAPHWQPGQALLAEASWCRGKLADLGDAWGHKLLVALVGPSGAGKSTLLNALAGRELSPAGRTRPTTRQVVVYARALADVAHLVQRCGPDRVQVETDYGAAGLEHLVLVDTPDTNTLPENQALLACVLEQVDLLLAVFPAHNPKMHDNVAFLRPYVRQFPPEAVVAVLNWVDRVPRQELEEVILPDFRQWIAEEWAHPPAALYLVSARASLPEAVFQDDERPLHPLNQIDALRDWLFSALNRSGQGVDRRLARADHLLGLLVGDCRQALQAQAAQLSAAEEQLHALGKRTRQALLRGLSSSGPRLPDLDLHTLLYAALARRWWGPLGWLVMLWALLLRLAAFLSHLLRRPRFSPPLPGGAEGLAAAAPAAEPDAWLAALEPLYAERWPPAADALSAAGFSAAVREATFWRGWAAQHSQALAARWAGAQAGELSRLTNLLASWPLPLLANLPTLLLLGWACVQTVGAFLGQRYLPADYFRHAGLALAAVWLASFIVVQMIVSLALGGSSRRAALRALREVSAAASAPLQDEFAALAALDRACRP